MAQNILIGKTINKVFIADDKKAIKFVDSNGEDIVVKTDGDCCSSSYIQHVEFSQIFPATVTSVDEISMDEIPDEDGYGDVTACYGCKIKTDKGDFFIEYRNESNGYYGGNLCWPGEYFYGGVHGQNVSNEIWVELTADF